MICAGGAHRWIMRHLADASRESVSDHRLQDTARQRRSVPRRDTPSKTHEPSPDAPARRIRPLGGLNVLEQLDEPLAQIVGKLADPSHVHLTSGTPQRVHTPSGPRWRP